jgi:hypothetical protein
LQASACIAVASCRAAILDHCIDLTHGKTQIGHGEAKPG